MINLYAHRHNLVIRVSWHEVSSKYLRNAYVLFRLIRSAVNISCTTVTY